MYVHYAFFTTANLRDDPSMAPRDDQVLCCTAVKLFSMDDYYAVASAVLPHCHALVLMHVMLMIFLCPVTMTTISDCPDVIRQMRQDDRVLLYYLSFMLCVLLPWQPSLSIATAAARRPCVSCLRLSRSSDCTR